MAPHCQNGKDVPLVHVRTRDRSDHPLCHTEPEARGPRGLRRPRSPWPSWLLSRLCQGGLSVKFSGLRSRGVKREASKGKESCRPLTRLS